MLSDPTGGVGFSFGAILPSAHMSTIAIQQVDAIDGALGGDYAPTGEIKVSNSGGGGLSDSAVVGAYDIIAAAGSMTWKGTTLDEVPLCDSRDYDFFQPIQAAQDNDGDASGSWDHDAGQWVNSLTGSAVALYIGLTNLPNRGVLKSATVFVASSGHSAVPVTKPVLETHQLVYAGGAVSSGNSTTDPETTQPNYDSAHRYYSVVWEGGGLNQTLDGSTLPYLILTGETGTNSIDNAYKLRAVLVTVTCTKIAPG